MSEPLLQIVNLHAEVAEGGIEILEPYTVTKHVHLA